VRKAEREGEGNGAAHWVQFQRYLNHTEARFESIGGRQLHYRLDATKNPEQLRLSWNNPPRWPRAPCSVFVRSEA
jgi:hypothetical protein